MKKTDIVIGSAFGDEGKGLITDYLSSRADGKACVVRFNGGAQAGHTVETPDGKRHIFSHFGSGSFAGVPTFLSSFFVCNPIIFLRECKELAPFKITPRVFADPVCPLTTPYDIMINQIVEQARGHKKHGSVGVGFGETLERQSHKDYAFGIGDVIDADVLRDRLDLIRRRWVYARLAALGVTDISAEWRERFHSDAIRERFVEDTATFFNDVKLAPLPHLDSYDHLIFEGAQGLLLDQERGWFPHVTRSYTGIRNALSLAGDLGLRDLDVYYLTRSYATRHGAGPLPNELPGLPYDGIVDKTNKPNPYQGTLRFAWLDLDLFGDTVRRDLADGKAGFTIRPHLAMSCVDQIDGDAKYVAQGVVHSESPEALLEKAREAIGARTVLASFGPTRADVRVLHEYEWADRVTGGAAMQTDRRFQEQSGYAAQHP